MNIMHGRFRQVILFSAGLALGCRDGELRVVDGDRVATYGAPLKGSYVASDHRIYGSILGVQAGWEGWKERRLARDGLLSVQLILRCSPFDGQRTYSVPDQCQGYLFVAASTPRETWRLSQGTIVMVSTEENLEISAQLQANREPEATEGQFSTLREVTIREARLALNADTLREILAPGNLELAPALSSWGDVGQAKTVR